MDFSIVSLQAICLFIRASMARHLDYNTFGRAFDKLYPRPRRFSSRRAYILYIDRLTPRQ